MQVLLRSWNEVLIQIIKGRRVARQFPFHHWYQTLGDFIHLIPCKQIGDLWETDKKVFYFLQVPPTNSLPESGPFPPPICHHFSYFLSASPQSKSFICQRWPRISLFIEQCNQEKILFPLTQIAITKNVSTIPFISLKCPVILYSLIHSLNSGSEGFFLFVFTMFVYVFIKV